MSNDLQEWKEAAAYYENQANKLLEENARLRAVIKEMVEAIRGKEDKP